MLTLLTTAVLSISFAIFATQNTETVTVNLGSYTATNVPIYLLVLLPLVIGILFAYFIYVVRDLSQNLTINEQKDTIKNLKKELAQVEKRAHQLQMQNIHIKKEHGEPKDENSI